MPSRLVARPISPLLVWLFRTSKNICHRPSTWTMNGSATKRAGTSVTLAAVTTGFDAPGAGPSRSGDGPAYMATDQVHGRLASFERCPTALGSMVSIGVAGAISAICLSLRGLGIPANHRAFQG